MPFWGSSSNKTSETGSGSDAQPSHHDRDLNRRASQNDPSVSASQAAGTEWLNGHLHHLTPEQEEKLVEFKKLCEEREYYKADSGDGKPSHNDETMLYVYPLSLCVSAWSGLVGWLNGIDDTVASSVLASST